MRRRPRAPTVLAAVLALTAAACDGSGLLDFLDGTESAETETAAGAPAPGRTAAPEGAAPPARTFSRAELDPERLLNLPGGAVSDILGPPAFVRREAEARVWQYRAPECVLDLYLYDGEAGPRVTWYAARTLSLGPVSVAECFAALLRRGPAGAARAG